MHAPTDEQAAVHEAARNLIRTERGLIKTVAGAGCGKTTTLIGSARACREEGAERILYLAFNKALVEDGITAFKGLADVKTFNALAFEHTGAARSGRTISSLSPRNIIDAFDLSNRTLPIEHSSFARIVLSTLTTFCNSGAMRASTEHVQPWVKPEVANLAAKYCQVLFDGLRVNSGTTLPLCHELYVKDWHVQGCPGLFGYDLTLLDEAQDATGVMLASLAFAKRAAYVGDSCQQIYAHRGAQDAMLKIPGRAFPLSLSFRFGPQIADLANRLLATKATPPTFKLKGLANKETQIGGVNREKPHTRIFRTNTGLVRDALLLADCGVPFYIVGDLRDLKEKFESAVALLKGNVRDVRHPALSSFNSWNELEDWIERHENTEVTHVAKLAREYVKRAPDIVKLLSAGQSTKRPIATLTGAHRVKGREFDDVVIGSDFDERFNGFGRRKMSKTETDEELNLFYVALTRVKSKLEIQSDFLASFIM